MLRFVCISDTHTRHDLIDVPDADLVIHAGDCTNRGSESDIREFLTWYGKLPHQHKILIAGNHDFGFEKDYVKYKKMCNENGITYLQDSGIEIEGVKFWGSPQTPEFFDWAFNCWRFEAEAKRSGKYKWIGDFVNMIPEDTDILITHGPCKGILDWCPGGNVGCDVLLDRVLDITPKYHIFGHIHESAGADYFEGIQFINASSLNGRYNPNNREIKVWEI